MRDRNVQPIEELCISFPSLPKVDEVNLTEVFSPFGEIEKITTFPGRSYAFVRFKNVMAACRAKETLEGKLFGNPHVQICFADSETGTSSSGRNSRTAPSSSQFKSYGHSESARGPGKNSGKLSGYHTMRPPRLISIVESGDSTVSWMGSNDAFEQRKFQGPHCVLGLAENMSEHRIIPRRGGCVRFREFSQQFSQNSSFYATARDSPEDASLFRGAVKPRTDSFTLEQIPDQSSIAKEWKWEGTIAKGGIPICRACCFPVGKVLDLMLPKFLDCTERTDLDIVPMLYLQAASAWVVFFVPRSDDDLPPYNDFLEYLTEEQRAGITKLDERTTLFLIPPSEFSKKALEVPREVNLCGLVLRRKSPRSSSGSLPPRKERKDTNVHGATSCQEPTSSGVSSQFGQLQQQPETSSVPTVPETEPQIGLVPRTKPPRYSSGSLRHRQKRKDTNVQGATSYQKATSSGAPSQFGQLQQQQLPETSSVPTAPETEPRIGDQGNHHPENAGALEQAYAKHLERRKQISQLMAALRKQFQQRERNLGNKNGVL